MNSQISLPETIALKTLTNEVQFVLIPVSAEYGVVAAVKAIGGGKAACVIFAPATSRRTPFVNYRPTFLRKLITTDLAVREGRWPELTVEHGSAVALRNSVEVVLKDFENLTPETIQEVPMHRPTNTSRANSVSAITYRAPDQIPCEHAVAHLVGLGFTIAKARFEAAMASAQDAAMPEVLAQPIEQVIPSAAMPVPAVADNVTTNQAAPQPMPAQPAPIPTEAAQPSPRPDKPIPVSASSRPTPHHVIRVAKTAALPALLASIGSHRQSQGGHHSAQPHHN